MEAFDPEFASTGDYVALYRDLGWQAVPALHPHDVREGESWKRPAIEWRAHTKEFTPHEQAVQWFQQSRGRNVGVVTGSCSGGLWVLDLDTQRNPFAQTFLDILIDLNGGDDFDTPTQRTGGGGLQIFFRSFGGKPAPTGKTAVGVDVRGQGGFVMAPPSMHESGRHYEWVEGREPWRCATQDAPQFVIDAVMKLLAEHGHQPTAEPRERVVLPAGERSAHEGESKDAFGFRVDGREDFMARMVWARVIELRRMLDERPDEEESESFCEDCYGLYSRNVRARLPGDHDEALEREGRGRTAFRERWRAAMAKWDERVSEEARATPRQSAPAPAPVKPDSTVADDEWRPAQGGLFRVLTVADIRGLPDPQWLVEGMLIERSFALLYGAPGTGKSFVAISLALAVAGAGPWWGKEVTRVGPVLYLSSEGTLDMKFRIAAWEAHHQQDASGLPFLLIPETMNFMDGTDVQRLLATVEAVVTVHGNPSLIVVDTVSRVLPGADENLQKDMTMFIRACDLLRERFQACVLGVHHTSRQGNLRGSTVFDGAADALLSLERDPENRMQGKLRAEKIKAAQDGWERAFTLVAIPLDPLKGTQSLVAVPADAGGMEGQGPSPGAPEAFSGGFGGLTRATRQQQASILKAAKAAWDAGNPWSSVPQTRRYGRYAPVLMARHGISEVQAEGLMQAWIDSGLWTYEERDAKAKRWGLKLSSEGARRAEYAVENEARAPGDFG